jgi:chromate reductase, NAD(P)H dehydrogenase (quinone)
MKILIFAASLRKDSFNKKVARNAAEILKEVGGGVTPQLIDINDFEMPIMNEDLEDKGLPENVKKLTELVRAADAIMISTPEYNGAITPVLKNTIDWLSRPQPHPWASKPVLLMAASEGALGGIRGVYHSRVPLDNLGAFVFGQYLTIGKVVSHLNDEGQLDPETRERMKKLFEKFLAFAKRK